MKNRELEEQINKMRGIAVLIYEHELAVHSVGVSKYGLEAAHFLHEALMDLADEIKVQ